MTDRDHFAAAALTGLLVHANDGIDEETLDTPSDIAYTAYQMADAMLRERERTNHDAAPAARAGTPGTGDTDHGVAPAARARTDADSDGTDKAAPRPGEGTGDTPEPHATPGEGSVPRDGTEPVAWGVADGKGLLATSIHRIDAVDMQSDYAYHTEIVPLYRSPPATKPKPKEKRAEVSDSEPAAWATFYPNGSTASVYIGRKPPHAEPLYRHPQAPDFAPAPPDNAAKAPDNAEPVAWAALHDDGDIAWIGYTPDGAADGACGRQIVPLYRSPTLTEAEREALVWAEDCADSQMKGQIAATIRGLLERTGGGR